MLYIMCIVLQFYLILYSFSYIIFFISLRYVLSQLFRKPTDFVGNNRKRYFLAQYIHTFHTLKSFREIFLFFKILPKNF